MIFTRSPSGQRERDARLLRRRSLGFGFFLTVLSLVPRCSVSDVDYAGLACQRAIDCPPPYVCAPPRGGQLATCVPADQGVPTTDGGVCDVSSVSFGRDIQPLFNARCTDAGCHGASDTRGNLLLVAPGARAMLVNQPTSTTCSAERPGVVRVKPGDPRNSMIWRKTSNDPTKCGDPMPTPRALISVAPCDFAKLEAWIQQGALDN